MGKPSGRARGKGDSGGQHQPDAAAGAAGGAQADGQLPAQQRGATAATAEEQLPTDRPLRVYADGERHGMPWLSSERAQARHRGAACAGRGAHASGGG
jgi:hypothetical protein